MRDASTMSLSDARYLDPKGTDNSPTVAALPATSAGARVDFVDYGKALCIILVVMMHSTLGVGLAMGGEGWMHYVVAFSKPFRMPDFFLIAGLFLSATINKPWRRYLDRKVLHFAYFYVLWTAIQLTVKFPLMPDRSVAGLLENIAWAMVAPATTLWFIYLLPIFFLITRLTRGLPWQLVLGVAIVLEMTHTDGYGLVVQEFMHRFVYFYIGYLFAPRIFSFAKTAGAKPLAALAGLVLWAILNGWAALTPLEGAGTVAQLPVISLALGIAGALALVVIAALLARLPWMWPLGWLGQRTLHVYLAFFIFMAGSRMVLVKSGIITDIGTVSALVTICGVVGPLILAALVASTPLKYLFVRPKWARVD